MIDWLIGSSFGEMREAIEQDESGIAMTKEIPRSAICAYLSDLWAIWDDAMDSASISVICGYCDGM